MDDKLVCENVMEIEKYLRKVDYIIRKKGREILNDFNITVPQFTALQILIGEGDLTIGELSQKMTLACSTITDLIDRMEKSGLVVRKKDEKDKRVVRVEVQPIGYEIVQKVLDKRRAYLDGKLKGFKDEDKKFLKEALESLYGAMKDD
ncbi:MarR family winged helix-turn-helix transcriptional regulator [Sporanaerobacter acetigenes]|uniref:DNA-binding transcriptional regulator, MarR family n=1 Tax=Sporanaerobacter acetigenes DSM 13106 TaxID=1123281 RepID=A0A1M5YIP9_9FIRM|nr:MarR family transcriptional regulator [Sporanaerobacter acetigenes]SHI11890.1 DNA-binding transcriptional regulator, MarR family [Sporanaerobacter acetigenes DSM 13106]